MFVKKKIKDPTILMSQLCKLEKKDGYKEDKDSVFFPFHSQALVSYFFFPYHY